MAASGAKRLADTENWDAQNLYSDAIVNHSSKINSGPLQYGMSGEETGCQDK